MRLPQVEHGLKIPPPRTYEVKKRKGYPAARIIAKMKVGDSIAVRGTIKARQFKCIALRQAAHLANASVTERQMGPGETRVWLVPAGKANGNGRGR